MAAAPDHIRNPQEIYRQSFAIIRREADLSRFSKPLDDVAVRLIHACGMIDLIDDLVMSENAVEAGRAALRNCRPIVCDVDMVRQGIMRRLLPDELPILCRVADPEAMTMAEELATTRSAAAFDLLAGSMDGAIVAVGNAPTALFRLLEMVEAGTARPALVVGMPVGFVGAAESKEALIASSIGVPFIAVRGRRGGSAMAAAAVNAVAGGLSA
ncbi:MAG: precorrin-8X methylmutase [Pseudomonadota bacterium]